jgi:hypothetical protein
MADAPAATAKPPVADPKKSGPTPILFHFVPSSRVFAVDGEGFGSSGVFTVAGVVVPVTKWIDTAIRGILPLGISYGDVVIVGPDEKTFAGKFEAPAPPVSREMTQLVSCPACGHQWADRVVGGEVVYKKLPDSKTVPADVAKPA